MLTKRFVLSPMTGDLVTLKQQMELMLLKVHEWVFFYRSLGSPNAKVIVGKFWADVLRSHTSHPQPTGDYEVTSDGVRERLDAPRFNWLLDNLNYYYDESFFEYAVAVEAE